MTEAICAPGCGKHVSWDVGVRLGLGNACVQSGGVSVGFWAVKVRLDPRFQETGVIVRHGLVNP